MKEATKEGLLFKNQFSRKKYRPREILRYELTELLQFFQEIDAESIAILRIATQTVGELDQTLKIFLFGLAQILDLPETLKLTRVDNSDGDEDNVFKLVREKSMYVKEGVNGNAIKGSNDKDRSVRAWLFRWHGIEVWLERNVRQGVVELLQRVPHLIIMRSDCITEKDKTGRDHHGHPATLAELLDDHRRQDGKAEDKPGDMDDDVPPPVRVVSAVANPVPDHA